MKAQAPPTLPKEKQPFIRMLMPAVMLVAVLGMVGAMVLSGSGRSPMTFVFPLMMLGSMVMMFQPGGNVDETRRSFHRHIDAVKDAIQRSRRKQIARLAQEHPDPRTLWTHLRAGEDATGAAGVVRLGIAVQAPEDPLEIPVTAPPEDLEPVSAMSLRDLAIRTATIEAPVAVDLASFHSVVIVGDGAAGLSRAMQAQLVCQDKGAATIVGPHDQWLPHDGPATYRFCDSTHPVTSQCVVHDPSPEWLDVAKAQGLLLKAQSEAGVMRLSAWTVDGWSTFGVADQLSDVELAMLCRARSTVKGTTSILELPGGDLSAPIGFSGAPVYLDIKESALGGIGPHGLCIGATGSGKSELLKAVVVSFAHQHSAEELNFVLVDFKGGASFLGLDRLPHTSAVITNLADEAGLVDRMQDSLLGEMHRRQERLRAAGMTTAAEFNRAHPGAMPALFIIVDEFSELLHCRPEFADVFAAIGRLGRSLRMHLLLASQRLEEGRLRGLESHLSYRIALRTFSAAESRALIGSAAAHELPAVPGSAILCSHETTRFKAAYVSGPELPRDQRVIRALGAQPEATKTTLDMVVDRLAAPNTNPIWLPPLPTVLRAPEVVRPVATLCARVGVEDLPFDGKQVPYDVDLTRKHWVVVGQPQSGKTFALRTLVIGLALSSPNVPIYIFDPGGSLASLRRLPQVAAVVGKEHLKRLLDEADQVSGHRVLIIDGIDSVGESGSEEEQRLIRMTTTGLERGLHVVVTALRWNLRPTLRDVLTGHLELRMTPLDSVFRDAQRSLPDLPGRGVSHNGKHLQVALSTAQDVEHVRRVTAERGEPNVEMRVLPDIYSAEELAQEWAATGKIPDAAEARRQLSAPPVPFALGGPRLEVVAWDSGTYPHLFVVGQSGAGATTALRTLCTQLHTVAELRGPAAARPIEILATDTRRGLMGCPGYLPREEFKQQLGAWAARLRERIPQKVTSEQLRERSWWTGPELYVVVDDSDSDPGLDVLLDVVPFAADVGLHLVLARRSGLFSRSTFQPLMQAVRDQSAWVVLSAPREDGPIAGQKLQRREPGRGVYVHSEPWAIHVARHEDEKGEQ
ncbi:FtsK/SpoIIIE domain-containing protein [Corynebacterium heidelbergense]|uniref:Cell division protein FtsK n=1 Tax=Corynebacterium heidelbergense TaxID=2055947 RepID=A0A364VCT8_9CORY|nr:FtsK/SpoIIIE domain-containing protein [Corynebacterium heidelbergense]RAV34418.1 cell division protein FtsK [Corynebacterium heidelbergense]WCZ37295.1 ESX-1 secretion system protein EccCa1 [Corynebacterium heidelbergense]